MGKITSSVGKVNDGVRGEHNPAQFVPRAPFRRGQAGAPSAGARSLAGEGAASTSVSQVASSSRTRTYESRTRERIEKNGKTLSKLGLNLTEITPIKYQGPALTCQVAGHGSLDGRALKGDELQHDHIPSIAAIKIALEGKLKRRLNEKESKLIYDRATTVELPDAVHALSRTYKWRNTQQRIAKDAENLYEAARKDIKYLKVNLMKLGVEEEEIALCIQLIHQRNVNLGLYDLPTEPNENDAFMEVDEEIEEKSAVSMAVDKDAVEKTPPSTLLKILEVEGKAFPDSIVYTSPQRSMLKKIFGAPVPFPLLEEEVGCN